MSHERYLTVRLAVTFRIADGDVVDGLAQHIVETFNDDGSILAIQDVTGPVPRVLYGRRRGK